MNKLPLHLSFLASLSFLAACGSQVGTSCRCAEDCNEGLVCVDSISRVVDACIELSRPAGTCLRGSADGDPGDDSPDLEDGLWDLLWTKRDLGGADETTTDESETATTTATTNETGVGESMSTNTSTANDSGSPSDVSSTSVVDSNSSTEPASTTADDSASATDSSTGSSAF